MPYEDQRDLPALELYTRYNQTAKGIRVLNHRKVYLLRRTPVLYAPVDPGVEPMRD